MGMYQQREEKFLPEENNDLLTIHEVAQMLRADDTTVRRWCKQGTLEHIVLPHVNKRAAYRVRKDTIERGLRTGSFAPVPSVPSYEYEGATQR